MARRPNSHPRPSRGPSSEVGQHILEAARRLLSTGGVEALTISALETEAGVYSSAIHYHFGSKSGLVAAVVEGMLDEDRLLTEQVIATLPPGRVRLDEVFERFNMMGGRDVQLGFYEVLGKIVRDEEMRKQASELYSDGRDLFTRVFGADHDPEVIEALKPLGQMAIALLDGLNVQQLIDADIDVGPAITMMEDILSAKALEIIESIESARSTED